MIKKMLLIVLLLASSSWAIGLTFTLQNGVVTGTSPKWYEFDIMIAADAAGGTLGDGQVYLYYNTLAFGPNVSANTKITAILGSLVSSGYVTTINDTNPGLVSLVVTFNSAPAAVIPTTPTQYLHVMIQILDVNNNAGISFDGTLMAGNTYDGSQSVQYAPIYVGPGDDATLPVELSDFAAVNINGVVKLTWTTQSEQNNLGFNIYRSSSEREGYEKINGALIPGAGTASAPRSYSYIDDRLEKGRTYYYQIEDIDTNGRLTLFGPVSVSIESVQLPEAFYVQQNYPNPFNPTTAIEYGLPETAEVRIQIFNMRGELIRTLVDGMQPAGHLTRSWDGRNDNGTLVPSGVYFCRVQTISEHKMIKMVFAK